MMSIKPYVLVLALGLLLSGGTLAQEDQYAAVRDKIEECTGCHGRLAEGTERGPNLIHPDYGPGVRSDAQLRRAVREGMPARLGYGAMPPSPDVSERRLERMITFVRELQRANGIR